MEPHNIARKLRALVDEAELYSRLFENDEASDRAYGYLKRKALILADEVGNA